ncbi:hypothetical protein ACSYAD_29830 [Acaryochloris marina NIES-2412]|uniref:hypothetical protein n=1 Tax=Acaryochloris marina TaxID=155978 RepID=UPI0040584E6C
MLKQLLFSTFAIAMTLPMRSAVATEIPKELQSCLAPSNFHRHTIDDLQEMVLEKEIDGFYLIRLQYSEYRMWMVASLPCYHHTFVGGDGYPPNFMGLFRGKGKGMKAEKPFTEYAQKSDTEYYLQRYPELQKK